MILYYLSDSLSSNHYVNRGNNSFMGDGSTRMDNDAKGSATFSMSFTGTVEQASQLFGRGSTQNLTNTNAKTEDK
jgi:hypothetical protein